MASATTTQASTPGVLGILKNGSIITVPNFTLPKSLTSQYDYFTEPNITYQGQPAEAHIPITLAPPLVGGTLGKIAQIIGVGGIAIVAPIVGAADLAGAGAAGAEGGSSAVTSATTGASGVAAGKALSSGLSNISGDLTGLAGLAAIGTLLTDPQFYIRVLEVVAGLYLLFLGVKTMTTGSTSPTINISMPGGGGGSSSSSSSGSSRVRAARTSGNPSSRRPANKLKLNKPPGPPVE